MNSNLTERQKRDILRMSFMRSTSNPNTPKKSDSGSLITLTREEFKKKLERLKKKS